MKKTTVIHINDRQPDDVYIGRAGHGESGYYGNPFPEKEGFSRADSIAAFERYFIARVEEDEQFRVRVLELAGKRLACFCRPRRACHGDVIAAWVNEEMRGQGKLF
jgi:hypothetical protein